VPFISLTSASIVAPGDFAKVIEEKNDNVATTFGLDNIDVITTFPTDLNKSPAQNDNAGRFGLILSAISQMGKDLETSPGATIEGLVWDINGTDGSHPNTIDQNSSQLNEALAQ
jgi:hypothetical protein